jgi:hypothetical protein
MPLTEGIVSKMSEQMGSKFDLTIPGRDSEAHDLSWAAVSSSSSCQPLPDSSSWLSNAKLIPMGVTFVEARTCRESI